MTTAQDFLMGGGGKSAKFPTVGTSISGRIVAEPEVAQQTEFGTGRPLTWDDGRPRLQLVIRLQTDERDTADVEDDGVRSLYVKGKSMTNAVRDAVKKAGAKGLEVDGILTVTYVGDGKAERGMPPKLYTAVYERPIVHHVSDMLGHDPEPAAAPAGQAPSGVDPAIWAQMGAEQRASVLAAMQATR